MNEEEVPKLIEAFKNTLIYIPVLLGVGLGLRRGEALALKWEDIDFSNKTIKISKSLIPTKEGSIFYIPKTQDSRRIIVAPNTIIEELVKAKNKQDEYRELLGKAYKDNNLITCYDDGSKIHPSTLSHQFARILKKNNLQHIRFHDLRHTNATLMLKHKVPAKVASQRLGHSTIGITLDLYSHVLKEMQEEAANKLNDIFIKK